ncbi:MAG: HEPN domain-containing protein [Phycisphaerales bacterium]|nr:HEPN domain-containing protein [Phycisphaerales bacterium]
MKTTTREWVDKAEADYAAAVLLRKSRKKHARDIVCFHQQQCVEKYLKARLEEGTGGAGIAYPRTHDLERLLDLALPVEPLWAMLRPVLITITTCAVEIRYPGRSVTASEANIFLRDTTHIRHLARRSLGLP